MINWNTRTADTIADIRTTAGVPNTVSKMRVMGHTTAYRGGGGVFIWRVGTPPTDDNGINIVVSGITSGWWQRNYTGPIYPRFFGAYGDDTTNDNSAWLAAATFTAPLGLIIDGEAKSYKISGLDFTSYQGLRIQNTNFRTTAGTYGIKTGDIDQSPTSYRRVFSLKNVFFTGSSTYALIVSTITGVILDDVRFQSCTCTNDVMYLSNIYDAEIKRLSFIACNVGTNCSCINMDEGVNGIHITNIYTSAFSDYGIKMNGNNTVTFGDTVLQGHTTAIYITGATGIIFHNPYFENVVNPVEITNVGGECNSIIFYSGSWGGPYPSHPDLASNNSVMIKYTGALSQVFVHGGKFDVSGSSYKKFASVGGSAVMHIYNPMLSDGSSTPNLRNYLFKESTSLSVAGYNAQYIYNANTHVTVKRNGSILNQHIVESWDENANLIKTVWSPPNVGDDQAADDPYLHPIAATPKTSSYNISNKDQTILFDTSSSNLNANLPVASSPIIPVGKIFYIKKTAGNNTLTVRSLDGSKTVDGLSSFVLLGIGDSVLVQYDGTNYIVLTSNINAQNGTPSATTAISGASVVVSGTNTAGTVALTLTTPQTLAALDPFFSLTFSANYATRPRITFTPDDPVTAGFSGVYLKSPVNSGFQIASGPGVSLSSGTYTWDYIVHQ